MVHRQLLIVFLTVYACTVVETEPVFADEQPGTTRASWYSSGISLADYDGDGLADLYVANWMPGCNYQALGLTVVPADDAMRTQLDVPAGQGVVVTTVVDTGPAARAGIQLHDLLLTAAGKAITSGNQLLETVTESGAKELSVELVRKGERITVKVTPKIPSATATQNYIIGVNVAPVDETLRSHLRLDEGVGLVVTQVHESRPAAKVGIEVNDIVLRVEDNTVGTLDELQQRIAASKGKTIAIRLLRSGERHNVNVTPEGSAADFVFGIPRFQAVNNDGGWYFANPNSSDKNVTFDAFKVTPAASKNNKVEQRLTEMLRQIEKLQGEVESLRASVDAALKPRR